MPVIEVDADQMQWPARCCSCGSSQFGIRPHTEDVVMTTIPVTTYRHLEMSIPVCGRCAGAHVLWFGAAALLGGGGYLLLEMLGDRASTFALLLFACAIAAAIVGVRRKPLKILGYHAKKNLLRLKIKDAQYARDMVKLSRGAA